MRKRRHFLPLAGTAALLLLSSMVSWNAPDVAVAQSTSCVFQPAQTSPSSGSQSVAQNLTFTLQQKQALCQAAESLERQNVGLSQDVASALMSGALGPVGPLAVTEVVARSAGPDLGAQFDVTLAATTSGFAGTVQLNASLVGYLRALTVDASDSNFMTLVPPTPPPFVFPSIGPDTNPPVAGTFRALLVNQAQAVGVAQALLHSLRRARGAAAAGNASFQTQQLRAAGLAAGQLATLLSRETPLRLAVQAALSTERLPAILGDPALVGDLQGAVQALGLFAATQGVSLPAPPPPVPPALPVLLPPPPAPPAPPSPPPPPAIPDGE